MTFRNYVAWLKSTNQLITCRSPLQCDVEIAEAVRQHYSIAPAPKALLFTRAVPSRYSVICNLFLSSEVIDRLLTPGSGITFCARLRELASNGMMQASWLKSQQNYAYKPDCYWDVRKDMTSIDLGEVPFLRSWPADAGGYLSQALVIMRTPEGASVHCGIYRLQQQGPEALTLHCLPGSRTKTIHEQYRRMQQPMTVAIVLGGDPALLLTALMPLEEGIDPISFAGWIQGDSLRCVESPIHGIPVPAEHEFLLEGVVESDQQAVDGPHGNHSGYYTEPVFCPVITVNSVLARDNAICPATIVGPPPTESFTLGYVREQYIQWWLQGEFTWIEQICRLKNGEQHQAWQIQVNTELSAAQREQLFCHPLLQKSRLIVVTHLTDPLADSDWLLWRCLNVPQENAVIRQGDTVLFDLSSEYGRRRMTADGAMEQMVRDYWHRCEADGAGGPS